MSYNNQLAMISFLLILLLSCRVFAADDQVRIGLENFQISRSDTNETRLFNDSLRRELAKVRDLIIIVNQERIAQLEILGMQQSGITDKMMTFRTPLASAQYILTGTYRKIDSLGYISYKLIDASTGGYALADTIRFTTIVDKRLAPRRIASTIRKVMRNGRIATPKKRYYGDQAKETLSEKYAISCSVQKSQEETDFTVKMIRVPLFNSLWILDFLNLYFKQEEYSGIVARCSEFNFSLCPSMMQWKNFFVLMNVFQLQSYDYRISFTESLSAQYGIPTGILNFHEKTTNGWTIKPDNLGMASELGIGFSIRSIRFSILGMLQFESDFSRLHSSSVSIAGNASFNDVYFDFQCRYVVSKPHIDSPDKAENELFAGSVYYPYFAVSNQKIEYTAAVGYRLSRYYNVFLSLQYKIYRFNFHRLSFDSLGLPRSIENDYFYSSRLRALVLSFGLRIYFGDSLKLLSFQF